MNTIDPQTLDVFGTVDVLVQNNGTTDITDSYELTLFEDNDNNHAFDSATDHLLGTIDVQEGPNAAHSRIVSMDVDSNVLFSGARIFAFADSGDVILETNEDNNLIIGMSSCDAIPPPIEGFDPVLEWEWIGSQVNATSNQVMCTPAVANLNDDNGDGFVDERDIPDIIFNTFIESQQETNGTLRAISGDGSGELFSVTDYATVGMSNPAVCDIDGDGLIEIVVVDENFNILCFENDGLFKWISDYSYADRPVGYLSPALADLDEDGAPEVIVGRVVLNNDGSTKWIGTGGQGYGTTLIANLDLQGPPELIAGYTAYRANGDIYWSNPEVYDGFGAVGNFDSDPYPEIINSITPLLLL